MNICDIKPKSFYVVPLPYFLFLFFQSVEIKSAVSLFHDYYILRKIFPNIQLSPTPNNDNTTRLNPNERVTR